MLRYGDRGVCHAFSPQSLDPINVLFGRVCVEACRSMLFVHFLIPLCCSNLAPTLCLLRGGGVVTAISVIAVEHRVRPCLEPCWMDECSGLEVLKGPSGRMNPALVETTRLNKRKGGHAILISSKMAPRRQKEEMANLLCGVRVT